MRFQKLPWVLTAVCSHADELKLLVRKHAHNWTGGKRCISISSFAPLYHVNQLAPQFSICELLCPRDYAHLFVVYFVLSWVKYRMN